MSPIREELVGVIDCLPEEYAQGETVPHEAINWD